MKNTLAILAAASLAMVGCEQQVDTMNESAGAAKDQIEQATEAQKESLDQQQEQLQQSAEQKQEQISAQAQAEKERLEAQAEAKQAQIEAQKQQVEAQAEAAKADAEAQAKQADAQQPLNEAAGAANTAQGATETDRALSTQVQQSLTSQNAALTGVTVMAADGKVTLRGTVSSEEQKEAIEAQAKAVSGVTSVDNQLEVKSE